jgi:hypothetical protein
MSTDNAMKAIADRHATIAGKIRALAAADYPRADIARALGRSYQQVRNVLEQDKVRAKASTSESGVSKSPATYETEVDEAFRAKYLPTMRLMEAMGWRTDGGVIIAEAREDGLFLMSSDASMRRVQAMVAEFIPPGGPSIVDELIADRRREAAAEEET